MEAAAPHSVPELVAALLDPGVYPSAPSHVELRETHISWVFLAGGLAYKVKKPLVLPFLDYGTPERRREMCAEEVRLNARLAPEIYLEVVGIARAGDRYRLTAEDDPAAVDYAVKMRRVEEGRSLAALAATGELSEDHIRAAARVLARFHSAAAIVPPERADVAVFEGILAENTETLRRQAGGLIEPARLEAMAHFIDAFMDAHRAELISRAAAERVRDCHGDLRAEHVIAPRGSAIYVYDCIEFNRELREIDVGADLAFLVMDLAALGAEGLAGLLAEEYRRAGGDPGEERLLWFYAAYRAWVRAKVGCVRAGELAPGDPELPRVRGEVNTMMRLGHRFAWRTRGPIVLVLCGVSATGKTSVARTLAELSGWKHLSSDVIRKRRAGLSPTDRGGPEIYTHERTIETYAELGRAAARQVRSGAPGVIVDATFHKREERDAFRSALGESTAAFFVRCTAPRSVLGARIRARAGERDQVSDADEVVLDRQLAELEPIDEVPCGRRADLLTDDSPGALAARVEGLLDTSPEAAARAETRAPAGE
jgi:aminoglycoside phosphotransferase family enzyme/predicted kinase